jgi:magnesium chelatase family protein
MALAIVYSRASKGIDAPLVTVEVHLSNGMPIMNMVGLAEAAVKESKDRVRSAIINANFEFPIRRMTINLAPADLPKEGGRFDLPIALGILAASGQISMEKLRDYEFTGELALSGELRAVKGVLPMVLAAYKSNRQLIVPEQNSHEAALVPKAHVFKAAHLLEVCAHLQNSKILPACEANPFDKKKKNQFDMSDVKGQIQAKRALEIAAAGQHSLLFIGPPGTGKTMLASRLTSILPEMREQAAFETAAIASVSHTGFDVTQWRQIPFRSPHHSSSSVALVGGGRPIKPGEISLAHHGVLFLDELPEFQRHVLECLREPLESGCITISRASYQTIFPAQFQLIAAMNPCPCGNSGNEKEYCRCSDDQIKRYLGRISAPLLDRIDMHVTVARLSADVLMNLESNNNETSDCIRQRVKAAQEIQFKRQEKFNTQLSVPELDSFSRMDNQAQDLLNQATRTLHFSARVYHRVMKVARTIADLQNSEKIGAAHLGEALNFRCLDRIRNSN